MSERALKLRSRGGPLSKAMGQEHFRNPNARLSQVLQMSPRALDVIFVDTMSTALSPGFRLCCCPTDLVIGWTVVRDQIAQPQAVTDRTSGWGKHYSVACSALGKHAQRYRRGSCPDSVGCGMCKPTKAMA
jgi:hypothetical protein